MISHIELKVSNLEASVCFYLSALSPLGFKRADGTENYVRITNGRDTVLVLCPVQDAYREVRYHRRNVGLGHFAITVDSLAMVDAMETHLAQLGIPLLGAGKLEIDYRHGYYTLAFEDPDRIMIEIVYHQPHYFSPLPP